MRAEVLAEARLDLYEAEGLFVEGHSLEALDHTAIVLLAVHMLLAVVSDMDSEQRFFAEALLQDLEWDGYQAQAHSGSRAQQSR